MLRLCFCDGDADGEGAVRKGRKYVVPSRECLHHQHLRRLACLLDRITLATHLCCHNGTLH